MILLKTITRTISLKMLVLMAEVAQYLASKDKLIFRRKRPGECSLINPPQPSQGSWQFCNNKSRILITDETVNLIALYWGYSTY